jgi:hypothetical protein
VKFQNIFSRTFFTILAKNDHFKTKDFSHLF